MYRNVRAAMQRRRLMIISGKYLFKAIIAPKLQLYAIYIKISENAKNF